MWAWCLGNSDRDGPEVYEIITYHTESWLVTCFPEWAIVIIKMTSIGVTVVTGMAIAAGL